MAYVCLVGDPDSHGGGITSGASKLTVNNIRVAIIGSSVSDSPPPFYHSGKSITSPGHGRNITVGGKTVVVNGGGVSCGASVSATLQSKFSIG